MKIRKELKWLMEQIGEIKMFIVIVIIIIVIVVAALVLTPTILSSRISQDEERRDASKD